MAIGASVEWDVGWNNCAAGQGRKSQALNLRLGRDLQRLSLRNVLTPTRRRPTYGDAV